jgi:hypothetical protein
MTRSAQKRVDGQETEVGRCVDHDVVIARENRLECIAQEPLAAELADQTHLQAGELALGRDDIDAVNIPHDCIVRKRSAGEHVDQVDAQ